MMPEYQYERRVKPTVATAPIMTTSFHSSPATYLDGLRRHKSAVVRSSELGPAKPGTPAPPATFKTPVDSPTSMSNALPPLAALLLTLAALLSGCTSGSDAETAASPPAFVPYSITYAATDCVEGDVVVLIDPALAARSLPAGFKARDAQSLLGTPAATGRMAAFLNTYKCGTSDQDVAGVQEAQIGIFIETPNVAGNRSAAVLEFYEVMRYTSGWELAELQAGGWNAQNATMTSTADAYPIAATAAGQATDTQGEVYSFSLTAGPPAALAGIGRFWHQAETGLAYADYELATMAHNGLASCAVRAGTPAAALIDATDCTGLQALGVVIPSFDTNVTFNFLGPVTIG